MSWKFEKEFRKDKPETIRETDSWSDLDRYKDWLEYKLSTLQSEKEELVEMLDEARLQIEYLHGIFKETGSGNNVLSRIEQLLTKHNNNGI